MAPTRIVRRSSGGFGPQNQVVDRSVQEQFRQPLYDRVNLTTSLTGEYRFFTNPIGASVTLIRYETAGSIQKTKRDTVLVTNGTDNSRAYAVHGVSIALIPTARTVLSTANTNGIRRDKDNIREGGYLNFKIVDTNIIDIPLLLIPEINAESGVASTANDSTMWGGPAPFGPMYSFGESITIPAGTSFTVSCIWDGTITLAQSYDMYLFFSATVRRPR